MVFPFQCASVSKVIIPGMAAAIVERRTAKCPNLRQRFPQVVRGA
jgi:hypothetical protein